MSRIPRMPPISLSTLVAVHLVAGVWLWLNIGESIFGTNQYITPLGWPNDAVFFYQEAYHLLRAERGLAAGWGYVAWYNLAGNAIMFATCISAVFITLERRRLGLRVPQRNTLWIMAGVLALILAANICKRPDSFLDQHPGFGAGYGLPYIAYSQERWFGGALSIDPNEYASAWVLYSGWNPANLFTNLAVATWILFATYLICERRFAAVRAQLVERPVTVAQEAREGV
jgi:hypothetical protein